MLAWPACTGLFVVAHSLETPHMACSCWNYDCLPPRMSAQPPVIRVVELPIPDGESPVLEAECCPSAECVQF